MDNEEKTDLRGEAIHDITNIFSGEENTETLFEYVHSKKRCVNFCPNFNTPFGGFCNTP